MGYYTGLGIDIAGAAKAVTQVAKDPCFDGVVKRVLTLREIEAAKPSKPSEPPKKPAGPGVGLCQAIKPLDAVIYVRRRPWVLPVGAAVVVGLIFGLGYTVGRGR